MAFWKDKKNPEHRKSVADTERSARILVLGTGCAKCNELEEVTCRALQEMGLDEPVGHERDFVEIAQYGVLQTPALVFEGKVLSQGRILQVDDVIKLLTQELRRS